MENTAWEQKGYKLRDYVFYKWGNNRDILAVIMGFTNEGQVELELIIGDKKSDVIKRQRRIADFSEIRPRDDFSLQYSIGDEE